MVLRRFGIGLFAVGAALGLSACSTYGDYGYGAGRSYYGAGLGYGYGSYGWYDDFYYPGAGYYVYDRGGRRHAWNDGQRRYWEGRRGPGFRGVRENWQGYRSGVNREAWQARREAWRAERAQRGGSNPAWRGQSSQVPRESWRSQQRSTQPRQGGGFRGAREAARQRD